MATTPKFCRDLSYFAYSDYHPCTDCPDQATERCPTWQRQQDRAWSDGWDRDWAHLATQSPDPTLHCTCPQPRAMRYPLNAWVCARCGRNLTRRLEAEQIQPEGEQRR